MAVGAVAIALTDGNDVITPPADGSTATETFPPSPSPSTLDRPFTAVEEALLARIPEEIRDDCGPAARPLLTAQATLACTDGPVNVRYSKFASKTGMDAAFAQPVQVSGISEGECATQAEARSVYTILGNPAGQVACYRSREGRSFVYWTDENQLIYTAADRGDAADLDLFRWWVESAGPLEDLPGVPLGRVVPKDVAEQLPPLLEGSFSATVTDAAAEGLDPALGLLTGVYRLDLSSGVYTLTRDSEVGLEGSYGLSKGDTITFSTSVPACGRAIGTFDFTLGRRSLTFEVIDDEGCPGREFILTAEPWRTSGPTASTTSPSPSA